MSNQPVITVLMPVYNSARFLEEAVESILEQTYRDFEFLIINDGSTDDTARILLKYQELDDRIRLFHQENRGVVDTLNRGLEQAQGKYIARMDADDISLPARFARQVAFMNAHPEVGICGTWVEIFSESYHQAWKCPTDDDSIRGYLLFESAYAHPSVMIRKEAFTKHALSFDPAFKHVEDYELWVRASASFSLANLHEVLLRYRLHENQVKHRHQAEQRASATLVRLAQLKKLEISPTEQEIAIHNAISNWQFQPEEEFIIQAHTWLSRLHKQNQSLSIYPEPAFSMILGERWFAACNAATQLGLWTWKQYFHSTIRSPIEMNLQLLKFAIKCAVKWHRHPVDSLYRPRE